MDSGNLAASLLTLRPGLLALADDKILGARLFAGLSDTLEGLQEAARGTAAAQLAQLQNELAAPLRIPSGDTHRRPVEPRSD